MDDDEIELNTSNQAQFAKKIDAKKKKSVKTNIANKKNGSFEKKEVKKKRSSFDGSQKVVDKNAEWSNGDDGGGGVDKRRKFAATSNNKTAKFSSLFKNNHEIPNVGE